MGLFKKSFNRAKKYCIRPSIFNSSVRMKNKFYYSWPWNTSTATVLIIILKVTIIFYITKSCRVIWYFFNSMDWEKLNSGYLWGWRIKKRISLSINCFHKLRKSLIIDFCQSKYWNTNFVFVTLPFNQYLHLHLGFTFRLFKLPKYFFKAVFTFALTCKLYFFGLQLVTTAIRHK